jgi:phenylalanyl-tRNA synthetase beta chain
MAIGKKRGLALYLTGDKASESWLAPSKAVGFPEIYSVVELILDKMGIDNSEVQIIHEAPFDYALQINLGSKELGKIGLVQDEICKLAEVRQEVFFADLNWDLITKKSKGLKKYSEISKFPEVRRDLSLVIDKKVTFDQIKKVAYKAGGNCCRELGFLMCIREIKLKQEKSLCFEFLPSG